MQLIHKSTITAEYFVIIMTHLWEYIYCKTRKIQERTDCPHFFQTVCELI